MKEEQTAKIMLPPRLVSKVDLSRLVREVEQIDNEFEAQKARARSQHDAAAGEGAETRIEYRIPPMSRSLSDFLELNGVDISDDHARPKLKEDLRHMKDSAPLLHMTFAVPADSDSLQELVDYIRREIHPQAILSVGLQPALVGGAYIRTPNHVHDFSMRAFLDNKRDILLKALEAGADGR